jgi:predicted nucleic acid-binding Zn ribbon protein
VPSRKPPRQPGPRDAGQPAGEPARSGGVSVPPPGDVGPVRPDDDGAAGAGTPGEAVELPEGLAGPQLARAVLDAAKARRGTARGSGRTREGSSGRRPRGYSGPGPDPRDPQPLGAVLDRLVKARGWEQPAAEGAVFGAWERVVGPDIAAHCRPVKLAGAELTIEAESTAWATQLRLLTARILRQIASEVGPNVVTRVHIHGPATPTWSRGTIRVPGRGPRDTYG